jgi:chromosome partitioning protein
MRNIGAWKGGSVIITIAHTKGGVGKSLLSWHLAIAMKVPIVDLDFQKTLVYTNSLRKQNGLKELDIVHLRKQEEFIKFFENWPDDKHLIVDVGGFDSNLNRMAMFISDIIITPAVDRVTEMAGLFKFHQIIDDLSNKMGREVKSHVLLNDVSPSAKDFSVMEELVEEYDRFELLDTVISHRADFYKTMEEGKGVTELKKSKAKEEIKKLIKEIKRKVKENG